LPGNSDISTDVNPLFTYPDTGVYTVTLIAYSSFNPSCADTTIGTVTILPNFQTYASFTRDTCTNIFSFRDSSGILSGSIAQQLWNFGDENTSTIANPQHQYNTAGNYIVTLSSTSSRGCTDTISFPVTVPELVHITSVNIDSPVCNGDCNAQITVQHSGGTSPYSYQWNDPNNQTGNMADSLCAGNYQVIITDKNGCTVTGNYSIVNPPLLTQQLLSTPAYCHGDCIGTASTLVSGGVPGYTYLWSDPNSQTSSTATDLCQGTYHVTVTDNNGCSINGVVNVNYSDSIPVVDVSADDSTLFYGQSTVLHATPNSAGATYSWTPQNSLNNAAIANPTASPTDTTVYTVIFTDQNGCSNTDSIEIQIRPVTCEEPEIFIPNAFSPNHDNQNEVLYVRGNTISTMELKVFDRWGELVFSSNDPKSGWDGTYKGKAADPGVFVYYLKVVCYNKEEFFKKGNITLIR
jgi:gliding motility-associated-like protein